jgi:hypothetical protein
LKGTTTSFNPERGGGAEFLAPLDGAVAWPLTARAQQGERVRRIGVGVLMPYDEKRSRDEDSPLCVHSSACGLRLDSRPQPADGPSLSDFTKINREPEINRLRGKLNALLI